MRVLTALLIKNRKLVNYISPKRPYLCDKNRRLAGKVLCVLFNKFSTSFEVSDFVKTSKKQRSNIVDIQVKDIFQYNFIGICIAHKKDYYLFNTSFLIRNTFDRSAYELHAVLYSPIIDAIIKYDTIEKLVKIIRSKYFYLRKKPMPSSTVFFDYVTDMFDNDVLDEDSDDEHTKKELRKTIKTK